MALRVLLADESATIKKVFQLSLQDYAAEVTTVNVGVDVPAVAAKVKPDIIFIDVLLQKRNGYEVCADLKKNPQFKGIPVVLIWSGFVELDQKKFKACGANAELEKPFDTDRLRQLIQDHVPKTKNQPLSRYLSFPSMPDFDEPGGRAAAPPPITETETFAGRPPETSFQSDPDVSGPEDDWSMENFAPLSTPPTAVPSAEETQEEPQVEMDSGEEGSWVTRTLTNYKMDKRQLLEEPDVAFEVPEGKIDADKVIGRPLRQKVEEPPELPLESESNEDEIELDLPSRPTEGVEATSSLSEKQIEALIRAEARVMIEKVIWEIVPEIATQIIEREIKRILKDHDEPTT